MKSILQKDKECYISKSPFNLHRHHVFYGTGKRALSEEYGLWIWLRIDWHTGTQYGIHFNPELNREIKEMAREAFEIAYKDENFLEIFGKEYLSEDD